MQKNPHLIEINALHFLRRMSKKYGKSITLDTIPGSEWDALAAQGFHYVWMMGVWKRSPGSRQCALSNPALLNEYRAVLPDFKDSDVGGSPYAVYGYELDPVFGKESALLALKENLRRAGLALILDYVPNHLALDHPAVLEKPEYFLEVSQDTSSKNPGFFFKTSGQRFLAHGRDPYFSPWTDTVQINYFSVKAREAAVSELLKIAQTAGGVRCDMAMLGLSSVFENTWGRFLENPVKPATEFWKEVISKVREHFPVFVFIAEVYWNLEWEMQRLGFDFTYDKKLYDRLLHAGAHEIRGHLNADLNYQEHSVRFLENHDEHRAVKVLGWDKSSAAAVITATVPGMCFFQYGQAQGKQIRVPVQLEREPEEKENPEALRFYEKLFKYTAHKILHEGQWRMFEVVSAGGTHSNHISLLSWGWQLGKEHRLIVVNYSPAPAQGRVLFQSKSISGVVVKLKDVLTGAVYERDAGEIKDQGLYVELASWKAHLFEFEV